MRRFGVVVAVAGSVLAPALAGAQSDAATATALFNSARADMKAGKYEAACAKLEESHRLVAAPGTLLNLADCEEKRGRLATAWQRFLEASQRLPPGDERARVAAERAADLERRAPRVSLRLAEGAPAGTRVVLAGKELSGVTLSLPLPMDPGEYEIVVEAPGHEPRRYRVAAIEKQTIELEVSPGAPQASAPPREPGADKPPPSPAAPPAPAPAAPTEPSGPPVLGWVAVGLGVAALGGGAVASTLAHGRKDVADRECPERRCTPAGERAVETGRDYARWSWIGYGVGAVGVGVGLTLVLTSGGGSRERATTLDLRLGAGSVALGGRFR